MDLIVTCQPPAAHEAHRKECAVRSLAPIRGATTPASKSAPHAIAESKSGSQNGLLLDDCDRSWLWLQLIVCFAKKFRKSQSRATTDDSNRRLQPSSAYNAPTERAFEHQDRSAEHRSPTDEPRPVS